MNAATFDVFISYRAEDLSHAEELNQQLLAGGFSVWFDRARLQPGFHWYNEIAVGCDASRVVVPVLTPAWRESAWTRFETYGAERTVPLLYEGDWGAVAPGPLQDLQFLDFRNFTRRSWTSLFDALHQHLAQSPPEKAPRFVSPAIPSRNPFFVGREERLLAIHEKLHCAPVATLTQSSAQAVYGLGGVGKTTLAREYAERFWRLYDEILWVSAERPMALEFQRLAEEMHVIRFRSPDPEVEAQMALRELISGPARRLLVLDNVPDEARVKDWLPHAGNCRVLITSRFSGWSAAVQRVEVPTLEPDAARELLMRRSGLQDSGPNWADADRVAKELGYLPLALEHAATFVREDACDFGEYLKYYAVASSRRDMMSQGVLGSTRYPVSVSSTWLTTVERLGPLEQAVLRFIAFLAPDEIPLSLLHEAFDQLRTGATEIASGGGLDRPVDVTEYSLTRAVSELSRYSMVTRRAGSLSVHRIVQAVQRDGLDARSALRYATWAVKALGRSFPKAKFANWPLCERLLSHAQVAASEIDRRGIETAEAGALLFAAGRYLTERARYAEGESLCASAARVLTEIYGEDDPRVADSMDALAAIRIQQGQFSEAESLLRRALGIRERVLAPQHPDLADSLNTLAVLYAKQAQYADAESLYRKALVIWESALGNDATEVAVCLNNLGELYRYQGRDEEAESLYLRAMAIEEKVLGHDDPESAVTMNNLGELYRMQGRLADAVPLYLRAVDICERSVGPDHPRVCIFLNNLASAYMADARHDEAELILIRAVETTTAALGQDHPDLGHYLNNLAVLRQLHGRFAEAEPFCLRALAIWEKAYGPEHPLVATSLANLAHDRQRTGRYEEAAALFLRVIAIDEQTLGVASPELTSSLTGLVRCYQESDNHLAALPFARRVLAIQEEHPMPNAQRIASALNNLGLSLVHLGELAEAEEHLVRASHVQPELPNPHYWLARLYQQRGQSEDSDREETAWQQYLRLGATTEERKNEAEARLHELRRQQ